MAKPFNISQLPINDKRHKFAEFDLQFINKTPSLLKHYVSLIEAVEKQDGTVEDSYGQVINVYIPKTKEELDDALRTAQSTWDTENALYQKAKDTPDEVQQYQWYTVNRFAQDEGLPKIEKPVEVDN